MPASPNPSPEPTTAAAALMEGGLQLGLPLSPHTVARLVVYLQELQRWNAKVNLTGPASERDIVSKHFLDSLAAATIIKPDAALVRPGPGLRLLDVGTGAGFPGLVLKLQDPDLAVTLLEPSPKKAAFLHHMIGTLGLTGMTVLIARDPFTNGPSSLLMGRSSGASPRAAAKIQVNCRRRRRGDAEWDPGGAEDGTAGFRDFDGETV